MGSPMLQIRVPIELHDAIELQRERLGITRTALAIAWLEAGRAAEERDATAPPPAPVPVADCSHPRDREYVDGYFVRCGDCQHRVR